MATSREQPRKFATPLGGDRSPSSFAASAFSVNPDEPKTDRKCPSRGALLLLEYAYAYRKRHRKVTPAVAELAKHFNVGKSTVQRWAAELTGAGLLLRVYNGGQGRRRACIWYVGREHVARARTEFPIWDERREVTSGEKKPSFGSLAMGRRALAKRRALGLKIETLNDQRSSRAEESLVSQETPIGEPQGCNASISSGSPGGPPTLLAAALPYDPATGEVRTLDPPRRDKPATPPRGEDPRSKGTARRRVLPAHENPILWRHAWWLWTGYFTKACRGRQPARSVVESNAMGLLVRDALRRSKGDYGGAVGRLAWWFRRSVRDPSLTRFRLVELWRNREPYGLPPPDFRPPGRRLDPKPPLEPNRLKMSSSGDDKPRGAPPPADFMARTFGPPTGDGGAK